MADEISFTGRLNILSGNYAQDFNPGTVKADLASTVSEAGAVAVSSSATALDLSNLSTYGAAFLRHIGTSSDADILVGREDSGTFRSFITLKPGEFAILRMATNNVYHKTASGSGSLQYFVQSA